jgi:uncharacterized membrane protein YphA (DoxX/SURF4 family)
MKLASRHIDLGLLLLRLLVGGVFINHGLMKLTNMGGTIGYFDSLGFGPFLAYAVAIIETVGGVLMVLGLWTPIVAILFVIIMLVAILKTKMGNFSKAELDLIMILGSAAVFFAGNGKYAVQKGCGSCATCDSCKTCDAAKTCEVKG